MKKQKIFLSIASILLLSSIKTANAASVSVSASSNYITNGSKVTFYIKINNAASWVLNGSGIGNTSGCSLGDERVGDSGTGKNTTKTLQVTCNSSSVGIISFNVSGSVWDENYTETKISTSKSVTVQAPREKDTNNYLKSLSIKDYTLAPEFNKETLEYSVSVPSTVNKITIEATKESNYASMVGPGEFEVNEGINSFEVKVTSETGIERVYTLKVNVEDKNPINIKINNNNYTIMKNAKTLETPSSYEATTIKIKDFDIPAFYSETSKITLVGVKDTKGTTAFAIYDKEKNTYSLYNENKSNQLLLYIKEIKEEKEGFNKEKVVINSVSYDALVSNVDKNIILINAMNIVTGKTDYYVYNKEDGTYSKYNDALINNLKEEQEKYKEVIILFGGISLFLLLIVLILLFRKPKRKKMPKMEEIKVEKIAKNIPEEKTSRKEQKKKKSKEPFQEENKVSSKEESLKQVSDVANLIEEYEKTVQIDKKKFEKNVEQINEETMYDIFEDEKRKKRKSKK